MTAAVPFTDLVQIIRQDQPDVQAIYVFGSFAVDQHTEDSDLDLALLLPIDSRTSVYEMATGKLRRQLEDVSGRPVDLVHLRKVDTVFQHQVIQTGRRIYSGDDNAAATFEMHAMSLYQKLNEERAEILEDIYRRGKVLE